MAKIVRLVGCLCLTFLFFSISGPVQAATTCYQETNFVPLGMLSVISSSCSSTPANYGWYHVDTAPSDLYVAIPYSLGLNSCSIFSYQGTSNGVPLLQHVLVTGISCETRPFPLSPTVPGYSTPVAGSRLWLRADAGITAISGKVSVWADQSGYGNSGYMPTASRQPTIISNALNGLPVIRFGGAQSLLLTAPFSYQTFTIFIVGKNSKTTENFSIILGPGGTYPNNQLRWENGSQALFVGTGNNLPVITSTIGNTRIYHALSVRYDGTTMTVYRDGNLMSTHMFTTTGPWTLSQIGAWFSSYFLVGDIAEIVAYPTALSDTDRITTNSYLKTKYALP